jgi:hypothetical protein
MAQVTISSPPTTLSEGLLQLQGGVAMSGTLTSVTDQNNTASTLKLSTTSAQFVSPLRITTDDPSDFYLDCEDGSTNNRFSITRNTASQQVNLNFASNPAGSTTIVGAVRTYVDGVNLSEVMKFREDGQVTAGYLAVMGSPINDALAIHLGGSQVFQVGNPVVTDQFMVIDSVAGSKRGIKFGNQGSTRQGIFLNNNDLQIAECNATNYNPWLTIDYLSNGNVTIGAGATTSIGAKLGVKGSGSTSATTSLLVQNSSGNRLLEQKDDGSLYIGNTASNTGTIFVPHSPTYADRVFMRIDGGFPLFSTISNALLEISCSQFYTQGNMAMRNMNQGIIGQTGVQTNNSSIQLTTSVNAYNGTNQDDACNLLYVKNNGVTLQAGGSVNFIKLDGQVNEAGGGGVKFCTGIYYNPTLTGGTLLDNSHYCYHATSGQMMVNTTSPQSSAQLQVDSTTRGFLPPRMTTAQKNAIVTPAIGLMIFDTDLGRPCFYNGAWVTL